MKTWTAFEEIGAADWDDLLARSSFSSAFQTYWWLSAWWETLREPSWQLRLIGVQVDNRLAAMAPMYLDSARQRAFFVGLPHGDYATVITDRANSGAAAEVIGELLTWCRSGVTIELSQLPVHTRLQQLIVERGANPFTVTRQEDLVCPSFRLTEETVAAILRKKSGRRHAAALRQLGNLSVQHLSTEREISPWLDAFFRQHVERWSSTAFPSLFVNPRNRDFYARLVRSPQAESLVIFTVVLLNGEPAAFHFGFGFGGTYYWYKPTFHLKLARSSPGEFLLNELIAMALRRGFTTFDFGRGDEPFKRRYASEFPVNENLVLFPDVWSRASEFLNHQARRVQRRIIRACVE